jgi:hypothetical protein
LPTLIVTAAAARGRRAMKIPERVEIPFIFRFPRFDQLDIVQIVHVELYATTAAFVNNHLTNSSSLAGILRCK